MLVMPYLVLSVFSPASSVPEKAYVSLADHVDRATLVCIGHVDEVIRIETPGIDWPTDGFDSALPIARIVVERVLKGPQDLKVVYHEVWGTWTCDTTTADIGQRALFLLSPDGKLGSAPPEVRDAVSLRFGTNSILRNVGSGDGIMPIRVVEGEELVHCSGAPEVLRVVGYDSRLVDVVNYIEVLARFAPELVSVHARSQSLRDNVGRRQWFDARILAEGSCRLAVALASHEEVRTLQLEEAGWRLLRSNLESCVGFNDRVIGDSAQWRPERKLVVRAAEGTLTLVEPREFNPLSLGDADWLTLRDALVAWEAITQFLDCRDCYDHSGSDRAWLQAR